MPEPNKPHYLAFVDGLRAVAIIAVVGFHVGLPGFAGGFVGVDVFFVISGFLIISQIRSDLERGRFSVLSFYARRSLRILPPFFILLVVVYAMAAVLLPTPEVAFDFTLAAALAPLMLTNILFYTRQGYFDVTADDKPLLHTWTLSVEEQFYLVAPLLLIGLFHLGRRRFGGLAVALALMLAAASLAGAIAHTVPVGRNPAFYLPYWRAWEFIAGGLIGASAVAALARAPRWLAEAIGAAGLCAILAAVALLDARSPYPSYRAVLPVAGASLVILAGLAQPHILSARLLATRAFTGIGLVSYGWYLWHWPLLSFLRIVRVGEASLPALLAAAALAFALACLSYRYVEQPIRTWRLRGGVQRPAKLVTGAVAAGFAIALLGGLTSFAGYAATRSFVAARYGIDGAGVLENGCRALSTSSLPDQCYQGRLGMLVGDSHADALFGTFARRFEQQGIRLSSIARGGCNPALFARSQQALLAQNVCASLRGSFERLVAMRSLGSVIIASAWTNDGLQTGTNIAELISAFDPTHTRILVIGPVPMFAHSSLDCVVMKDRLGEARDHCGRPRAEVEAMRAGIAQTLKTTVPKFANARLIDPMEVFCDEQMCRPFAGDTVFYRDAGHVLPAGADRIYDGFRDAFRWVAQEGSG